MELADFGPTHDRVRARAPGPSFATCRQDEASLERAMPSNSDTLQPSGQGLGAPPRRLWVELAENLTLQAIGAVLFANAATLPLLIGGWLSGVAYAITALTLSCVALAV